LILICDILGAESPQLDIMKAKGTYLMKLDRLRSLSKEGAYYYGRLYDNACQMLRQGKKLDLI